MNSNQKHHPQFINQLILYITKQRWFRNKSQKITSATIIDILCLSDIFFIVFLELQIEEQKIIYVLFLETESPTTPELLDQNIEKVKFDALQNSDFCCKLKKIIHEEKAVSSSFGKLSGISLKKMSTEQKLSASLMNAEQSNTNIIYSDDTLLKIFRQPEYGINPDAEINCYLTNKHFCNVPETIGTLKYYNASGKNLDIGIMQDLILDVVGCWEYTLELASSYLQNDIGDLTKNKAVNDFITILAKRTAELHITLACDSQNPNFKPEKMTNTYTKRIFSSFQKISSDVLVLLENGNFSESVSFSVNKLLQGYDQVISHFSTLVEENIDANNIRCHGDYHLGQVIKIKDDVIILDFEGEPLRNLDERREKQSPFKDVAGMLRSFHYAISKSYMDLNFSRQKQQEKMAMVEKWIAYVQEVFLQQYLGIAQEQSFLPTNEHHQQTLLRLFLFDKAFYELKYECTNRPDWMHIPLMGICRLIDTII